MRALNRRPSGPWSVERLHRTAKRLADEDLVDSACSAAP